MWCSLVIDPGLDKLQELLLGMVPGDELTVARAVEVSGLHAAQCDAVLEALMRAGLMVRLQTGDYVRCRLDGFTSSAPARRPLEKNG